MHILTFIKNLAIISCVFYTISSLSINFFNSSPDRIDASAFDVYVIHCVEKLKSLENSKEKKPKNCNYFIDRNFMEQIFPRNVYGVDGKIMYTKSGYLINVLLSNGKFFHFDSNNPERIDGMLYPLRGQVNIPNEN
jgi:hypothetical protein